MIQNAKSQSPQVGAMIRTFKVGVVSDESLVSIPSSRGNDSDTFHPEWLVPINRVSQSPQVGAMIRTNFVTLVHNNWDMSQSPQVGAMIRTFPA